MTSKLIDCRALPVLKPVSRPARTDRPEHEALSTAPTRHKIEALDGLRGLAVLLVLWAHMPALNSFGPIGALNKLAQPGYLGVDVFFVLSGFLVTRILLHGQHHGTPLPAFYVRRAARILPAYYLTIAAMLVCAAGPYVGWCAAYLSNVYFAFSQDPAPLRHTWSLCVEAHFYVLWPLVVYATPPRRHALVAAWVVAIGFAAAAALALALPSDVGARLIYRLTVTRMASLGIGALFAVHEARLADERWRRRWQLRLGAGAVGLLAAGFAIYVVGRGAGEAQSLRTAVQMAAFTLASGGLLLVAIGTVGSPGWLARSLAHGPLPWVGSVSYGVYLYHYPIFVAMGVLGSGSGTVGRVASMSAALLATIATFAVACVSYRFIERPITARASARGTQVLERTAARQRRPASPAPALR